MGFVEEACTWKRPQPRMELCAAPSIEREADEIARRILEQAAAGRPSARWAWWCAARKSTSRPAGDVRSLRYSRAILLRRGSGTASAGAYLTGIVDALSGGWDHAETLAAIRLAPGIACDEFDFAVREQDAGPRVGGAAGIGRGRAAEVLGLLQSFEKLEAWRRFALTRIEWAERLKELRELFAPVQPEPGSYEIAAIGRGQAAALDVFDGAMDEAARALGGRPVGLGEFWRAAKSVLRLTPLRVDDAPPQRGARAGRARGAAVAVAGGFRVRPGGARTSTIPGLSKRSPAATSQLKAPRIRF